MKKRIQVSDEISSQVFDSIIDSILLLEGGYIDDKRDSGSETKLGISKKSYPELDIKALTREEAKYIYKQDFWNSQGYRVVRNPALARKILNIAINCGAKTSVILLQRTLRAFGFDDLEVDGEYGEITNQCIKKIIKQNNLDLFLQALSLIQKVYYYKIVSEQPHKKVFLDGWLNRAKII
jgi:lysozyme family protein